MTHSHDPSCRRLADRLSEYLDEELPPDLAAEVAEHFESCERCEAFLDSLRNVRGLGRILPRRAIPPDRRRTLVEEVRKKLREMGPK